MLRFMVLTVFMSILTGCASKSLLYDNRVVMIKPFENFSCPKNQRIVCLGEVDIGPPPFGGSFQSAYHEYNKKLYKAKTEQMKNAGADISVRLGYGDISRASSDSISFSMAFVGGVASTAAAVIAGPGASELVKSAISGASIGFSSAGRDSNGILVDSDSKPVVKEYYLSILAIDMRTVGLKCPSELAQNSAGCLNELLGKLTSSKSH